MLTSELVLGLWQYLRVNLPRNAVTTTKRRSVRPWLSSVMAASAGTLSPSATTKSFSGLGTLRVVFTDSGGFRLPLLR